MYLMYLIFNTLESAQAAQATIDSNIVAIIAANEPEIVSDRGIIPRNLGTGQLDYEATRTTTWCEPAAHGDIWYLIKPEINHPYFDGIDLCDGVVGCVEAMELPEIIVEETTEEGAIAPETIDVEITEETINE